MTITLIISWIITGFLVCFISGSYQNGKMDIKQDILVASIFCSLLGPGTIIMITGASISEYFSNKSVMIFRLFYRKPEKIGDRVYHKYLPYSQGKVEDISGRIIMVDFGPENPMSYPIDDVYVK